jgi:hypothetical protein
VRNTQGRRGEWEKRRIRMAAKNSAGVASLRGQGTPAYPARLRSERARNSSRIFLTAGPRNRSRMLPAARQKLFKNSCRRRVANALEVQPAYFFRRKILGGRESGSGGLAFLKLSTSLRRHEGIRSARWRQPRRRRLLREARCVARGRGSGRVRGRPG